MNLNLVDLYSHWYVMNAEGEIRRANSIDEIANRESGEWRAWWQIARTELDGIQFGKRVLIAPVKVSTVFLGVDHGYDTKEPILFETMIFGGPCDGFQWRYSCRDCARLGHQTAVDMAKMARFLGESLTLRIMGSCWETL